MAKYTVTSKRTGNSATVEYDSLGTLIAVEYGFTGEDADAMAVSWMQQNLPIQEAQILKFFPGMFTVDVVIETITFSDFWETYGKKIGKQQAEKQWSKLTIAERGKAIRSTPRYKLYCSQSVPPRIMKDPERYLSQKVFNDEVKL